MTHLIALPDGRTIAVDDQGSSDGAVVVFLHAAPGSRRLDPDPEATAEAGVRLLTLDRPGYGASSPVTEAVPTIDSIADDLARALSTFDVGPAAIVGWSAGGRVALAVAARHPHLVRSVGVVATPAPDEAVPWVPEQFRAMTPGVRADPAGAVPMLAGAFAAFVDAPDQAVESVTGGPADDVVLADPAPRDRLVAMLAEAFRAGAEGAAADVIALNVVPDDVQLREIAVAVGAPVSLFYGDADAVAGPEHGRWWERSIPDSALHVIPGAGHLVALTAWHDILAAVTT
ncbi:MAG TPA: alpha/beta fold hydrolase [Jiangellaceae bacterium]|jgi:pimeloyl-ACP methyl ester carboxylesterase|nr:alpha/beta fold hydrolase [Jiangellaceae bacterium]